MKTLTITKSPSGYKLKQPITIEIPESETLAQKRVRQYIIDTFIGCHPKLVRFTLEQSTTMELARHLLRHRTGSLLTLRNYIYDIRCFTRWLGKEPDELVRECKGKDEVPIARAVIRMARLLTDFADNLQARNGQAPKTVSGMVENVRFFFRLNGVKIEIPYRRTCWSMYQERAPTPEELQKILSVADERGKAIVALMALGGFRRGTLVQLKYRHVKRDLESGITPVHVHVEASITKGKRRDYDTYLNREASEHLQTYLEVRKKGTRMHPPQDLLDESPLISNYYRSKPIRAAQIQDIVNDLYIKAGLLTRNPKIKRYALNTHSLRRFFMTQMMSAGIERDYVEYMMGHSLSVYHDVKMKGVDFLRGIYLKSGISIQPRTRARRIQDLIEITRTWGLNPEEVLRPEVLNNPS